jgi:hypothetical protein
MTTKSDIWVLWRSLKLNFKRLAENGKSKMVVIGAVMRKLSHIIYGILKSGQEFNPAMTTL